MLPFCFCWLGGLPESDMFPPTTPLPADPELPPLLPMTPTPLPGANPPTGLSDMREDPCIPDCPEPRPRIPELMPLSPGAGPSSPPEEEVGPPTVMLPLPMEPTALLEVEGLMPMPPREPGRPEPMAPEEAA